MPVEIILFDEATDGDVLPTVEKFKPDIIGISVVTPTFPRVNVLCGQIRQVTNAPIVAGGPHITAHHESILHSSIDLGVIGEGEATFLEVVQCFLQTGKVVNSGIRGIIYCQEAKVISTPQRPFIVDLDSIPPPDRALFKTKNHYARPRRIAHGLYAKGISMVPSRGCVYGKCNFCSSFLIWGNTVRFFSPSYVVNEIEGFIKDYNPNFVIFLDDNFTTSLEWLEGLAKLLKERGLNQQINFDCESIAAFMDDRRAFLLKEMGCVRIEFGFESGSARILDVLKSGRVRLEHNIRAINICKSYGISILGNAVFGYIDETPEEFNQSASWFLSQPIDYISPHIYTPYPGTSGWNECVARGIIDPENIRWEDFLTHQSGQNLIVNTEFLPEEFNRLFKTLREKFNRRNQAIMVERGLSFPERLALYSLAAQDNSFSVWHRLGSPKPKTPNNRYKLIIYYGWFSVIQRFMRLSKKLWLTKNKGAVGKKIAWFLRGRFMPWFPLLGRLSFGSRWLAWNDVIGRHIYLGEDFEQGEQNFLFSFLQPGITFLDLGAHQGLYTLLASKKSGSRGQVIAFEPSPREFRRLKWHLAVNCRRNVRVEPFALGSKEGTVELFISLGQETGCNSLRHPAVSEPVKKIQVPVTTLDRYLQRMKINKVDFVKIDVEGAELDVFKGSGRLLAEFRPLILCELADIRTESWGYRSADIYEFLAASAYKWFMITSDGQLQLCPQKRRFHENLLAVPVEKLGLIEKFVKKI